MTPARIASLVGAGLLLLFLLLSIGSVIENVDSSEIVVKQSLGGQLEIWTTQGPKLQNFGGLESYRKSGQIMFGGNINIDESASSAKDHKDQPLDEETSRLLAQCLPIRFNDKGSAKLCGSISFDLPTDPASMTKLHTKFRSQEAIEQRLIYPALMKAAYNSGPMMSSEQSAGDRRAELLEILREQATEGIYRVVASDEEQEDLLAEQIETVEIVDAPVLDKEGVPVLNADGTPKMEKKPKMVLKHPKAMVKVVRPKIGADGKIEIAEPSTASEYGLRLYNFTINRVIYDERVRRQNEAQQEATMAIQTARANSKRAEQDALTAHAEGEARIARAKADKEVEKQSAVTEAEKKRDTAQLDLAAADFEKQAAIKRAEGEAEARKLVMVADGALDKKLALLDKMHKYWSEAAGKQQLVPTITMGGSGDGKSVGVTQFMDMMTTKAVRDLALDMSVKGQ
jgi:regulator of protease activity HflC (stomatin/prohibitin superfamily)